jgi:regulator of protease activity HflC (stomatin/prohibitin superfamily)
MYVSSPKIKPVMSNYSRVNNSDDTMATGSTFIAPVSIRSVQPQFDHSQDIYTSLPDNAKKYFREKSNLTVDKIVSELTMYETMKRFCTAPFGFPLMSARVEPNQLVPVVISGKHKLLKGPRWHWPTTLFDRVGEPVDISRDIIFGSIKLVYVNPGCLRYALNVETSAPMLLGPGMHFFDDPSIIVHGDQVSLSQSSLNQGQARKDIIPIGPNGTFSFVFIKTGHQGVVNCRDGVLKVLDAGLHFIEAPDRFVESVCIQQEHFKFGSCSRDTPIFLTADNVELHVDARLFYNCTDVKKVYTTIIKDEQDLEATLLSQAMSTLMTIIRSETFSNIGKKQMTRALNASAGKMMVGNNSRSAHQYVDDDRIVQAEAVVMPAAAKSIGGPAGLQQGSNTLDTVTLGFQNIIHDAEPRFKQIMQENFGDITGFNIQSLRIEKIEFANKSIQREVADLAISYTKLSAQEATIAAQRKVQLAEAERDAAKSMIAKNAELERKQLEQKIDNDIKMQILRTNNDALIQSAEAEMKASLIKAEAQAKNKTILAEAEAKNKLIIAEAEAKSILEVGNAEVEINKKMDGSGYAMNKMVAESQVKALKDNSKIIYTNNQPLLVQGISSWQGTQ